MCLPGAIYQNDVETINHKIEDQRFPTESKQEEDKENAWDSGSLFESSTKIQVCTPESIYQSVTKHINREVEEPPEKSSAFKPATEIQNSVPNEAFECKKEQPLTADQMIPSESKPKDNEENSWDLEVLCIISVFLILVLHDMKTQNQRLRLYFLTSAYVIPKLILVFFRIRFIENLCAK
ncbi:ankyrin repeat domain-containing protein 30B-like [Papio anubis]|uniref:ankyrin repeat domain-containing protein 30B-like n=1 Tax=Papio anubis TaxID=9555 RepID=UPI0012AE6AF9|nr:ankyrin repeat domain-containing protein 30B-like [Papio anubis]